MTVKRLNKEDRLRKLNARIPVSLIREEEALEKKLRKPKLSPLNGLEMIYGVLDLHMQYTKGLTACSKGCDFCCHMEVAVSRLEADFIAAKTGYKPSVNGPSLALSNSKQYCDEKKPCPFLDQIGKICSIYVYRPMMCRTHLSFEESNTPCRFDAPKDSPITLLDRAKSWPSALRGYFLLIERHGGGWADIRDYFGKWAS